MKKNFILQLLLMTTFVFMIHSCIHDDIYSSKGSTSAEYHSKSPFKEDEKYIRKTQGVFLKHANLNYVHNRYGELYWDYAMSFGQFNEKYTLVPVVKDNKVVLLMEAVRNKSKVYFYEKNDTDLINFFNAVIFSNVISFNEVINGKENTSSKGLSYVCSTRAVVVGCPDGVSGCSPSSYSSTVCEWQFVPGSPPKGFDPIGDPDAGGGGSGYEYPDQPEEIPQDPCDKLKTQNVNLDYKAKIDALNKTSVFKARNETGFKEKKDGTFIELSVSQNTGPNHHALKVTYDADTQGYIHSHQNDYDTGTLNGDGYPMLNLSIRMFSPADVDVLMGMAQLQTDGNYEDLYGTMVSSDGIYTIKFDGTATDIKTGFGGDEWRQKYINYFKEKDGGSEYKFLNFLKYEMGITGVSLYKINSSGIAQKKELSNNNNVQTIDCPN